MPELAETALPDESLIRQLSPVHVNDNLRLDASGLSFVPWQRPYVPPQPEAAPTQVRSLSERFRGVFFRALGATIIALGAVSYHAGAMDADSHSGTTYEYQLPGYSGAGSDVIGGAAASTGESGAPLGLLLSQQTIINSLGLKDTQKTYLTKMILAAEELQRDGKADGINLRVMVGQAIQESGWSGSNLSNNYNNPFGMKYWGVGKATPPIRTPEWDKNGNVYHIYARFRAFDTLEEGLEAYVQAIRKGYPAAVGHPNDPLVVLQALEANPDYSWASDKEYVDNVMSCIKRARLSEIFALAGM